MVGADHVGRDENDVRPRGGPAIRKRVLSGLPADELQIARGAFDSAGDLLRQCGGAGSGGGGESYETSSVQPLYCAAWTVGRKPDEPAG